MILLFAQHVTHFERLPMPVGKEWVTTHRQPLKCEGDFVIPKGGKYTIHYAKLSCDLGNPPQEYRNVPVAPLFCDHVEEEVHFDKDNKPFKVRTCPGGNQEPIYDIDESYDHITVQAKPGTKWWYTVVIAVPK